MNRDEIKEFEDKVLPEYKRFKTKYLIEDSIIPSIKIMMSFGAKNFNSLTDAVNKLQETLDEYNSTVYDLTKSNCSIKSEINDIIMNCINILIYLELNKDK